ncbi:hypothetical protein PROFUN_11839 [Planoprotostelium fungivorum]|uniref:Uncharacterized protein n=1 Tax=Planoprotostelium fungivorum TaxID=1890364 RepID=A0A2P6N998_9EUKA|nr:hypothetical protein PROFUN_11839 [Planoprotostelium fungivorum]
MRRSRCPTDTYASKVAARLTVTRLAQLEERTYKSTQRSSEFETAFFGFPSPTSEASLSLSLVCRWNCTDGAFEDIKCWSCGAVPNDTAVIHSHTVTLKSRTSIRRIHDSRITASIEGDSRSVVDVYDDWSSGRITTAGRLIVNGKARGQSLGFRPTSVSAKSLMLQNGRQLLDRFESTFRNSDASISPLITDALDLIDSTFTVTDETAVGNYTFHNSTLRLQSRASVSNAKLFVPMAVTISDYYSSFSLIGSIHYGQFIIGSSTKLARFDASITLPWLSVPFIASNVVTLTDGYHQGPTGQISANTMFVNGTNDFKSGRWTLQADEPVTFTDGASMKSTGGDVSSAAPHLSGNLITAGSVYFDTLEVARQVRVDPTDDIAITTLSLRSPASIDFNLRIVSVSTVSVTGFSIGLEGYEQKCSGGASVEHEGFGEEGNVWATIKCGSAPLRPLAELI